MSRYLMVEGEQQREVADRMLANSVILRYLDERDWFDLHPAVYDVPEVAAAIRERRTEEQGRG